ncbi:DUF2029 domain-containing protein [Sphingomonas oligophenolica]|uniref:DUF2029 domain-containing protein n=2 Tax=Sphingomonas oligophenolica TaxID=301154 RepID=A0A502CVH9_9SPHN|nr:DUF2029 domain-containing protein [Sphingomonas oligophenolica]
MTGAAALSLIFLALALLRPIDHDESQYVAAAVLTAHGLLQYRDYAYLQTPLQPLLLAPVAALAGSLAWPALRIVNALFGVVAVIAVAGAARTAGASRWLAVVAAGLFATTDILLFSIGTARNDALPAACLAVALWLALRPARTRAVAAAIGGLLAAATAAKLSYAFPALAYGGYALVDAHRQRPGWVLAGVAPLALFVAWTLWLAPQGFAFGVFVFPQAAPDQYYRAAGRAWKLTASAKIIDFVKFLALGPALLSLIVVGIARGTRRPVLPLVLIIAGLFAALLPTPTWRQYLLPLLPPLFVALALVWTRQPPARWLRVAMAVFVGAGLAPSLIAIASGGGMVTAIRDGTAIRTAMDRAGATGAVATLSPAFVPATARAIDPRFATGPFYFRSRGLLSPADERALTLVSRDRAAAAPLPPTVLTGGEGPWTSGDAALDQLLADRARGAGYRKVAVPGDRFTLWIEP